MTAQPVKSQNQSVETDFRELLKRTQYISPAFEIYGSPAGFQVYGVLGSGLKRRVLELWRSIMCPMRSTDSFSIFEIDTPIVGPESVYVASGHVAQFTDPVVKDKDGRIERVDHYLKARIRESKLSDDEKESKINTLDDLSMEELQKMMELFGEADRKFEKIEKQNLMLSTKTNLSDSTSYLRPETAQGLFSEFKNLFKFNNECLPFGIAQTGRVYRKEISPRPFVRLREFEQAEIEVFHDPQVPLKVSDTVLNTEVNVFDISAQESGERYSFETSKKTIGQMVDKGLNTFIALFMHRIIMFMNILGVSKERIRFRQHLKNELAHYSSDCWDMEYLVRDRSVVVEEVHPEESTWIEVIGIADRGCYDLTQHQTGSGSNMSVRRKFDPPQEKSFVNVKFNMKLMAKNFKQDVQLIRTYIEDRCAKDDAFASELIANSSEHKTIEIAIEGKTFALGPDMINISREIKKIAYEEFVPHVIEPSFGIDRLVYSVLNSRYWVRPEDSDRAVLSLNPSIAPIQVAILPLYTKDIMMRHVPAVTASVSKLFTNYTVDCSGASIGKRYSRMDEIGVPFAITIDYQTDEDNTVTVRCRDSTEQERVSIDDLPKYLAQKQ
ncbi:glycyl-tRNA synthetase [Yasminevirus sp. GU-2018]|uniref:glycine--tRNA ligase n=1 Tax=Yasminevirus sp. GU-2018 TaxID=2420051 RepID=A0A5K0U9C7_9VIRU|nr:glycyl-tRNA synthetase [Yasminevirus sp. GU-2018]